IRHGGRAVFCGVYQPLGGSGLDERHTPVVAITAAGREYRTCIGIPGRHLPPRHFLASTLPA
ncbi:MAG: hypothetical protein ACR2RL_14795, partial [Gammaproteobacteria bacterium]